MPEIGIGGKHTTRMRMLQTVMPYAVQHNLPIDTNYEVESTRDFAKRLRRLRGNVLVVWEHHNIVEIARDLGLKDAEEWNSDDFDSIWTITFERLGRVKDDRPPKAKKPRLTISRQGLNPSGEFLDHRAGGSGQLSYRLAHKLFPGIWSIFWLSKAVTLQEVGRHKELLTQGSRYAELFKLHVARFR